MAGWKSGWRRLYVALLVVLVVVALLRSVRIGYADRPTGDVDSIATLRERTDLNVIFVVIDTLRADRLPCYGYERNTSPILCQLADSGVRFARATSESSWTKTSMASILTATYPVSHGILRSQHAIPEEATLPAEIFRDAGYFTSGIWRNGWVEANFGFGQGFDIYNRPVPGATPEQRQMRTVSSYRLAGSDLDITNTATEFLRTAKNRRFFLYLHYMDVHQYVYDGSADFGTTFSDLYDNAIHWVDRNIGALVGELQARGLMDKTILVIGSDHGEAFLEHGSEGHARNLYTEVIDVPLILVLPFRLEEGIVVNERVGNVDIFPTVLDLVGLDPLPGAQGESRVPEIEAAGRGQGPSLADWKDAGDRPVFSELDLTWGRPDKVPTPLVAATRGPWRFMAQSEGFTPAREQLFDHRDDPGEQRDLSPDDPSTAADLRATVEAYRALPAAPWGSPREVHLDEFRLQQLRALGYVVGESPEDAPEGEGHRE